MQFNKAKIAYGPETGCVTRCWLQARLTDGIGVAIGGRQKASVNLNVDYYIAMFSF